MKDKTQSRCECGLLVGRRSSALIAHKRSVYHKQHKRIERLLSKPCVNLTEIGRRVGVSRERMRQVYTDVLSRGKGADRQRACTIRRTTERVEAENSKRIKSGLLQAALSACKANNLPFSLVYADSGIALKRRIVVNGSVVALRKATQGVKYLTVHKMKIREGFVWHLIPDGRWLVLPANAAPKASTLIAVHEPWGGLGMSKTNRHDWREYIDAWHLLKSPKF